MKELLKYASGVAIGIVVTLVILSFIKGQYFGKFLPIN